MSIELMNGDGTVVQAKKGPWGKTPNFAIIKHRLHWAERRSGIACYDNVHRAAADIMFKMTDCDLKGTYLSIARQKRKTVKLDN